jgi:pimeloyl-ACP methyl ester carboxylesterase
VAETSRSTAMDLATVFSIAPVVLDSPDRGEGLQLRVSAPLGGHALPVILFSHGNGQSLYAYGPLVNYWAASGYIVINPTHLDSRMIAMAQDDPRRPDLWRYREKDLISILDGLDRIEEIVPAIKNRIDRTRITVAGHSWGAQTASTLLGATHPDPRYGSFVDIADSRVKAGVLLAVPGTGGDNLTPFAAQHFPFMHPNFSSMKTATLVVAGDDDHGAMTVRGPEWWREAYDLSPGRKGLFTVFGGAHSLGGIPNYESKETTDESPERVASVQRLSTAFLRSTLYPGDSAWSDAVAEIQASPSPQGKMEEK